MFKKDNIYYLPEYDAVIVAEQDGEILFCFDIFCDEDNNFNDILSAVANENCKKSCFWFYPKRHISLQSDSIARRYASFYS